MRTTITLDDDLLADAKRLTGIDQNTAVVNAALRVLVERESGRRLAALGGSEPALGDVRRRRLS